MVWSQICSRHYPSLKQRSDRQSEKKPVLATGFFCLRVTARPLLADSGRGIGLIRMNLFDPGEN